MDAFEAARLKHAKNLERRTRVDAVGTPEPKVTIAVPIEVPKESPDGIIEVTVTLPSGVQRFTLVKKNVFANAVPARLTRQAIINCMVRGLEPLLGAVKET